jgi:hypothetical protein
MPDQNLEALIREFTAQLTTLVRRDTLDQIRATLAGEIAAPRRTPTRAAPAVAKRGRRSSEGVAEMGEKLLAFVKSNPGKRGEEIAQALRTDVKTMRLPMLRLIAAKQIKTEGERRGMKYFVAGAAPSAGTRKPAKAKRAPAKKQAKRAATRSGRAKATRPKTMPSTRTAAQKKPSRVPEKVLTPAPTKRPDAKPIASARKKTTRAKDQTVAAPQPTSAEAVA